MKKIKEFSKKYLIGLSLSFLICISAVSAVTYFDSKNVTYNNETTGMASTNVQGAIDELYNACFPPKTGGEAILEEVPIVTAGDGLYKDEYEEGRYFYRGRNVNNYITFNNEEWRIISIEKDGTIKIMRKYNKSLNWNDVSNNDWTSPATLNTYLNETFFGELTSIAKSQTVTNNWSIGAVTFDNNDLVAQINEENSKKWLGKIGLITTSEYIRSHSDMTNCGTMHNINQNYNSCSFNNWMDLMGGGGTIWTISATSGSTTQVLKLDTFFSTIDSNNTRVNNEDINARVSPVLYLSSFVKITGGNGSQNNPYTIK